MTALALTAATNETIDELSERAGPAAARLAAVGIGPFPIRLTSFVVSAGVTGIAGALFADLNRFVSPAMLSWQMSGELIVLVVLGGIGRLFGPVAGALLYVTLEFALGGVTEHWQFFLGVILLGLAFLANFVLYGLQRRGVSK